MAGIVSDTDNLILFDLTQLVLRSGFATPTGIARVELAYARFLLDHHRARTRFLIAFPPKAQIIPTSVAARYIAATEVAWGRTDGNLCSTVGKRLKKVIGINPCISTDRNEALFALPRAIKNRLVIGAEVMMSTVFDSVRPRNLMAFGKSDRAMTYISVSGSRVATPWICRWLIRSPNITGVFLLHDLIPVTHPEYTRPDVPERHARYVRQLIRCASVVVTNSQFTAESLHDFADREGLVAPRTVVAALGIGDVFAKPPPMAEMPPYFVFLGTIEPRKNHILLLQVWQRLVVKHGSAAPKLVLVGKRGWENENVLDLLDRGGNLRNHVVELNQICDDLLTRLIVNARALLLPSHVEGYGLPVAEALALGTPVICSDLPSLHEIAGDIPEYIDPLAGRGWARIVMDYADLDNPRRRAQIERMQKFRVPSWNDHFVRLGEALPSVGLSPGDARGVTQALQNGREASRHSWSRPPKQLAATEC